MGLIIKQSAINTVISYVGVALGFVTTIWLYPNILDTDQYGLTRVLISIGLVSAQVSGLGIKNTILRYFPYFKNPDKNHHGFLFIALSVPLFGFLLFTILFFLFKGQLLQFYAERSSLLLDYAEYLLPLVLFLLLFNVLNNYVRALFDTILSSFLIEILMRIVVIINLFLYLWGWITFQQFILIFVLNYGLQMVLLFIYLVSLQGLNLRPDFSKLTPALVKEMASYGLFAFMGGMATIIVGHIDIIMLGSLAGLDQTGIYAIAFYVGTVIAIPMKAIQKISTPIVADAFKNKNLPLIEDLYKRTSLNQIVAGVLLFIGVWANLDNLMTILPAEYASGATVVLIIGTANLFDMATGINGAIIVTSKYYRFDLWSTLLLVLLTISLNYLLIPAYGIAGAAIATASAIFLYNLIKYVYVWHKFSMQPFQANMLSVLIIGAGILVLSFQLEQIGNVYTDILIRSCIIAALYLGLVYLFRLSKDFNMLVQHSITRLKQYLIS